MAKTAQDISNYDDNLLNIKVRNMCPHREQLDPVSTLIYFEWLELYSMTFLFAPGF